MKKFVAMILCLLLTASLTMTAFAVGGNFGAEGNVIDTIGVLTAEQESYLEEVTQAAAETYDCGCYIYLTDNLYAFGYDAPNAVINLYHDNRMGVGAERDGILLLVDLTNREFAFFVYGPWASYVFDAYGQEQLEKVFLDDFVNDQWYPGLADFAEECTAYMQTAAAGEPVRQDKTLYYLVAVGVGLLTALIVCAVLVGQMKSVAKETQASAYISSYIVNDREDRFLHKTTVVHSKNDDDSGGSGYSSGSFSGGGGSGRSGRF